MIGKKLLTVVALGLTSMACADEQYNVLLYMADDLHAGSLESYGSKVNCS